MTMSNVMTPTIRELCVYYNIDNYISSTLQTLP